MYVCVELITTWSNLLPRFTSWRKIKNYSLVLQKQVLDWFLIIYFMFILIKTPQKIESLHVWAWYLRLRSNLVFQMCNMIQAKLSILVISLMYGSHNHMNFILHWESCIGWHPCSHRKQRFVTTLNPPPPPTFLMSRSKQFITWAEHNSPAIYCGLTISKVAQRSLRVWEQHLALMSHILG